MARSGVGRGWPSAGCASSRVIITELLPSWSLPSLASHGPARSDYRDPPPGRGPDPPPPWPAA